MRAHRPCTGSFQGKADPRDRSPRSRARERGLRRGRVRTLDDRVPSRRGCTPTRCEERSEPPNGDSTRNEPRRPGRVLLRSLERDDPPSSDRVSDGNGSLRQVL
ncbi:hypothetical protein NPIL_274311 [Nephila pilipes]|uniref:Uncharacterized protein n=1 Tax=Nephila pilipes TaxID=299642 RepID=A0A8X6T8K0_NEPPI|nr:hypothetical protein NPIL_274311 [Nephila pilipes]